MSRQLTERYYQAVHSGGASSVAAFFADEGRCARQQSAPSRNRWTCPTG